MAFLKIIYPIDPNDEEALRISFPMPMIDDDFGGGEGSEEGEDDPYRPVVVPIEEFPSFIENSLDRNRLPDLLAREVTLILQRRKIFGNVYSAYSQYKLTQPSKDQPIEIYFEGIRIFTALTASDAAKFMLFDSASRGIPKKEVLVISFPGEIGISVISPSEFSSFVCEALNEGYQDHTGLSATKFTIQNRKIDDPCMYDTKTTINTYSVIEDRSLTDFPFTIVHIPQSNGLTRRIGKFQSCEEIAPFILAHMVTSGTCLRWNKYSNFEELYLDHIAWFQGRVPGYLLGNFLTLKECDTKYPDTVEFFKELMMINPIVPAHISGSIMGMDMYCNSPSDVHCFKDEYRSGVPFKDQGLETVRKRERAIIEIQISVDLFWKILIESSKTPHTLIVFGVPPLLFPGCDATPPSLEDFGVYRASPTCNLYHNCQVDIESFIEEKGLILYQSDFHYLDGRIIPVCSGGIWPHNFEPNSDQYLEIMDSITENPSKYNMNVDKIWFNRTVGTLQICSPILGIDPDFKEKVKRLFDYERNDLKF